MVKDGEESEAGKLKHPVWLIAAMSRNRVIGKGLVIPWRIPGEQRRFRALTLGKAVIMGRKTYLSLGGKGLKDRVNIVLTSSKAVDEGCVPFSDRDEALRHADRHTRDAICIAGGEAIYRLFMPLAQRIYLTVIDDEYEGNIFFPPFDTDRFSVIDAQLVAGSDMHPSYTYYTYERR